MANILWPSFRTFSFYAQNDRPSSPTHHRHHRLDHYLPSIRRTASLAGICFEKIFQKLNNLQHHHHCRSRTSSYVERHFIPIVSALPFVVSMCRSFNLLRFSFCIERLKCMLSHLPKLSAFLRIWVENPKKHECVHNRRMTGRPNAMCDDDDTNCNALTRLWSAIFWKSPGKNNNNKNDEQDRFNASSFGQLFLRFRLDASKYNENVAGSKLNRSIAA